jgi:hypothetical protein
MIALLILLLLSSCMKTEIINEQPSEDYIPPKPRKELPQQVEDTTRYEIGFNPSVEDWEEIEENL